MEPRQPDRGPLRIDAGTAYLAVDRHQNDDLHPYVYKTSDYGKTWTRIATGVPDTAFVRAVREDPKRRGLLTPVPNAASLSPSMTALTGARCSSTWPITPIHDLVDQE